MNLYILNSQRRPERVLNLQKWAFWYESADRSVACTEIGHFRISTVFLGIDNNFNSDGSPILWETMVFGHGDCEMIGDQSRCAGSWEQAEAMHEEMVGKVRCFLIAKAAAKL